MTGETVTGSAAPDPFPDDLLSLAKQLDRHAWRANQRGMYGLEEALKEAAESARSWAQGIEDQA